MKWPSRLEILPKKCESMKEAVVGATATHRERTLEQTPQDKKLDRIAFVKYATAILYHYNII